VKVLELKAPASFCKDVDESTKAVHLFLSLCSSIYSRNAGDVVNRSLGSDVEKSSLNCFKHSDTDFLVDVPM